MTDVTASTPVRTQIDLASSRQSPSVVNLVKVRMPDQIAIRVSTDLGDARNKNDSGENTEVKIAEEYAVKNNVVTNFEKLSCLIDQADRKKLELQKVAQRVT